MRRQLGVVVLGLMMGLGAAATAQAQASPYAFAGDHAVFMNFIKPDKTADYEMLIQKVKEGLKASDKPERKQMAESWKVYKAQRSGSRWLGDLHLGDYAGGEGCRLLADRTLLAEAFPAEARALYDTYIGAFPPPPTGQLFNMTLVNDLAK